MDANKAPPKQTEPSEIAMSKSYSVLSVDILRISESGKAVEVLDPERPADNNTIWIPCSLIDEYSLSQLDDYISSLGTNDIKVESWFLKKKAGPRRILL